MVDRTSDAKELREEYKRSNVDISRIEEARYIWREASYTLTY